MHAVLLTVFHVHHLVHKIDILLLLLTVPMYTIGLHTLALGLHT